SAVRLAAFFILERKRCNTHDRGAPGFQRNAQRLSGDWAIPRSARPDTLPAMAKLTAHSYDIARPTGVCAASGRPIEPGDTFVAALYEREGDDSFERRDYHAAMWEEAPAPAAAEGPKGVLFGHWRGVMPAPNAKPKLFVDDEAL